MLAGDTDDLRRAAAVLLHRQAGIGRSLQGGTNFQGASLAGKRESQLKFVPAEVAAKIKSSPPGGYCAPAVNRGWATGEPTRRSHFKRSFRTEKTTFYRSSVKKRKRKTASKEVM